MLTIQCTQKQFFGGTFNYRGSRQPSETSSTLWTTGSWFDSRSRRCLFDFQSKLASAGLSGYSGFPPASKNGFLQSQATLFKDVQFTAAKFHLLSWLIVVKLVHHTHDYEVLVAMQQMETSKQYAHVDTWLIQ